MTDEWYSFKTNPRKNGADVLVTPRELHRPEHQPADPAGCGVGGRSWSKVPVQPRRAIETRLRWAEGTESAERLSG